MSTSPPVPDTPPPLVVDAVADPASIAAAWRELEAIGTVLPFQSLDWVSTWIAAGAIAPSSRPVVIRARRGEVTEFLLPLVVERIGPFAVARRLAGSHASYALGVWRDLAVSYDPEEIRRGLRAVARSEGIAAYALDAVPRRWDGIVVPLAAALAGRPSLDDGHAVRLDPSFDAFLAGRNAGHKRKKLKAKEKLLAAAGGYRIAAATTPAEVEATLVAFFAQKSAALAARGISDPFAAAAVRDAFRRLALDSLGAAEPLLELTRLEAGGAVVAVIGASIRAGRLHALFASFAEGDLERASPGETLFFRHVESACRRGLAIYDFGVGAERYKASWCDERIELMDLQLPVTIGGRLLLGLGEIVGRAKAAIRRDERLWPLVVRLRARIAGRRAGTTDR